MKKITISLSFLMLLSFAAQAQNWWEQGLVAYYTLDINNPLIDSSVNNTPLTSFDQVHGAFDRNNVPNHGLVLPQAQSYIQGNSTMLPKDSAARSFSIWIRWDQLSSLNYSFIFFYGNMQNGEGQGLGIDNSGFLTYAGYIDAAGLNYDLNAVNFVNLQDWVHVGMSYDGDTAKLYINGILDNSGVKAWNTSPNRNLHIGRMGYTGGTMTQGASYILPFTGAVDDFRVYDRELSSEEMFKLSLDDFSALAGNGGGSGVGLVELNSADFRVYPNPATNQLHVDSHLPITRINVYHINGQLVEVIDYAESMDISQLESGAYILGIISEGAESFNRFIKL